MLETYESSMKTIHNPLTEVMNVLMSNKYLPLYYAKVMNGWCCVISYHIIISLLPPYVFVVFKGVSMKLGIVYNPWALYTMPKTLGKA